MLALQTQGLEFDVQSPCQKNKKQKTTKTKTTTTTTTTKQTVGHGDIRFTISALGNQR